MKPACNFSLADKIVALFLLLGAFFHAQAAVFAQNLVINPSFENTKHCVSEAEVQNYANVPMLLLSQCEAWTSFSPEGTADLYQPCNAWKMRGSLSLKPVKPKSGSNMAGFFAFSFESQSEYREYLHGKLAEPLKKGETYQLCFSVLLADRCTYAVSRLGVYFSKDSLYRHDDFHGVAPFLPQITNKKGDFLKDKENWTVLQFEYEAKGGEQFMLIGHFENDEKSDTLSLPSTEKYPHKKAYYYLDDVCVSAKSCPTEINLPTFGFKTMVFEADSKKPLEKTKVSFYTPSQKWIAETNEDGIAKIQLVQNQYFVLVKKDCFLPAMASFEVPLTRDGAFLSEQMQYFPMIKIQNGVKMALESDAWKSFEKRKAQNDDKLPFLLKKLEHWAIFLNENPSLKVCLNAAVYFDSYKDEAKRIELRTRYEEDLVFLKNYWLENGVNSAQISTRFTEITKENPAQMTRLDGNLLGNFSSRFEIEILENKCHKNEKTEVTEEKKFFKKMQKGEIFIFEKVNFSPDSPELKSSSHKELEQLAEVLKANPSIKIRINGHTDIGITDSSEEFLQQLSDNRAKAVADFLIKKGINSDRISSQGFANRKPIADNNTAAGRAQNRRVEVEIVE